MDLFTSFFQNVHLIIGFGLLLVIYFIYVRLIKLKNKGKEAFSGIDVQLKKRHDLIPNILEIAKRYMQHEKDIMTRITELRASAQKSDVHDVTDPNLASKLQAESLLTTKMGAFMATMENYPQLKADTQMQQAMLTYNEVEEQISAARRFYNSAANELNNAVEIFPSSTIAAMLSIKSMPFFEISKEEKEPISASDIFHK